MRFLFRAPRCSSLLTVLLALLSPGCGKKKSDPQQEVRQFFDLVTSGHADQAYAASTFAFQAQQSEKAFETRVKELGLVGAKVELKPIAIEGKSAKTTAEVTTTLDEKSSLVVTMENESGRWRVFSLKAPRNPQTGVAENRFSLVGKTSGFNEALDQRMPDEPTIRKLVHESLQMFSEALEKRSFSEFYAYTAQAWQTQLTEKRLHQAFQAFIDKDVRLSGVLDIEPVFDTRPQLTTDGLLLVTGYYPTRPFQVFFSLKYIYELPNWKLFGLDVYLKKTPEEGAAATSAATPK